MGESSSTHQNRSRLGIGLRNSGGEIVEVQGGHIVRSTGRKDRHSKVCTAKGPRDRRVRLAAHTAIQFYDVQDRLGYDRPSKAVDWLIKKAKSAIDELAELPAWNPITTCSAAPNAEDVENSSKHHQQQQDQHQQQVCIGGNDMMIVNVQQQQQQENANNSSFLPPSLDSDAIADTIKSFFPMGASSSSSSAMQFQSFQTPQDLRQNQDLRLSLQSFQDPVYPSHHNSNDQQPHSHSHSQQPHSQVLLSGTPLGFDGGWQEHQAELSRFQRFAAWNNAGGGDAGSSVSGGYLFNLPPVGAAVPQHQLLSSHNQFFSSQRGPLQSSNTPSVRAWMDPITMANAMADHHSNTNSHQQQQHQHQQHHLHPSAVPMYPSSFSGIGGFSGFHIPARIQGDEEEHDGYSDKPSSASSDSRH